MASFQHAKPQFLCLIGADKADLGTI